MRVLLPVITFFMLCGVLFVSYIVGIAELVSVLLLIPLFLWYRKRKSPEQSTAGEVLTLKSSLYSILGLYIIVMSFRAPSVAFLGFPLEKTPLIFLLVVWILYIEKGS